MAKSKLVGFKSFKSKKGAQCNMASIITDYTPAEISRGCIGAECRDRVPVRRYSGEDYS